MAAEQGHDPLHAGLFRSVLGPSWTVDADKWRAARAAGELVGQCRGVGCGGYLIAEDDPPRGWVVPAWPTARCVKCGRELVAPAGRVLHRSGRHGEAPDFWAQRVLMLKGGQP